MKGLETEKRISQSKRNIDNKERTRVSVLTVLATLLVAAIATVITLTLEMVAADGWGFEDAIDESLGDSASGSVTDSPDSDSESDESQLTHTDEESDVFSYSEMIDSLLSD